MKVLIIEDDAAIARRLSAHLDGCGFVTRVEADGENARFEGESAEYDVIVLDLGLPGCDGSEILRSWRANAISTPVLVLTARSAKADIVTTLEAGADDYVIKPFDVDVVAARLRTIVRRRNDQSTSVFRYRSVTLNSSAQRLQVGEEIIGLTRIEYLFVQYLFMHQGEVLSINELTDHVYDDFDNDSSIVPRHIANIRKKLGRDLIVTVSNRGYTIRDDDCDDNDDNLA